MVVETKYNIGDHVMITYEHDNEIHVYDDYIKEITALRDDEGGQTRIIYYGRICPDEIREEDVILFNDDKTLVETIKRRLRDIEIQI